MTVNRRERLKSMLDEDPADQLLRYMLALEYDKEGEHSPSLDMLRALMNDSPPYVPAFVMAGQQQTRQGNIEAARSIFTRASKQRGNRATIMRPAK